MARQVCVECGLSPLNGDQYCRNCGHPVAAPPPRKQATSGPIPNGRVHNGWAADRPSPAWIPNGRQASPPPPAGWMPNDRAAGAPPPGEAGEAFFSHERAQEAKPLNNATRYLCAAPYLDSGFADRVIGELVATRRAVAPSVKGGPDG
jgi:hypothetical protein